MAFTLRACPRAPASPRQSRTIMDGRLGQAEAGALERTLWSHSHCWNGIRYCQAHTYRSRPYGHSSSARRRPGPSDNTIKAGQRHTPSPEAIGPARSVSNTSGKRLSTARREANERDRQSGPRGRHGRRRIAAIGRAAGVDGTRVWLSQDALCAQRSSLVSKCS